MATVQTLNLRSRERRFYLVSVIAFILFVVAGFARTYYLKGFFGTPPLGSALVHLHGLVMTAWVVLFSAQVWLIRSKNIRLHQRIGYGGIVLAVLVFTIGVFTALSAAKNGAASAPPDIPPLAFLIVPLTDMFLFAAFFAAAVYYRKKPATHKRMILLTAINFLPPAVARLPIESLASFGPLFFFGVPTLILLFVIAYDTWQNRKLNAAFAIGASVLIASYPLRLVISGTEPWMRFAAWLTGFAIV